MPKVANERVKKASSSKCYSMPEKISEGTILTDLSKAQWQIGSSIGKGGFGEIYKACRVGDDSDYNYIVKCEPHENGPLFVEMHFYMRNAKFEDIKRFMQTHRLKTLGMPYMVGNGSVILKNIKHRFIVLPRFGADVKSLIAANGCKMPEGTAYRIALQMLDVYEFIHSCGYVHADLKSANIVLGREKSNAAQTYLIDFGLAAHYCTKDFVPDPKKMHNGTIEYTSRDAHQGVSTMRGDMEILGYNLIEWIGYQLPWVKDKLLAVPVKVQKAKEDFFTNLNANLKKLISNHIFIIEFMTYVKKMKYNDVPDYEKCRRLFIDALKKLDVKATGSLNFKNNIPTEKTKTKRVDDNADNDERVIDKKAENKSSVLKRLRAPKDKVGASNRIKVEKDSEVNSPKKSRKNIDVSPVRTTRRSASKTPTKKNLESSPAKNRLNIKCSPAITVNSPRVSKSSLIKKVKSSSSTSSGKTYEINFELDVSMDANIVVNVKRKRPVTENVNNDSPKQQTQDSDIKSKQKSDIKDNGIEKKRNVKTNSKSKNV